MFVFSKIYCIIKLLIKGVKDPMKKVLKSASLAAVTLSLVAAPVFAAGDDAFADQLDQVINTFVNWAAILAGLIALGYLIYAGIKYVTSAGDPGKTEEAQKQIVSAMIGLAIVILSYTILRVVLYLFGVGFGVGMLETVDEGGAGDLLP